MLIHCHICYTTNVDEDFVCDQCDQYYCEDCSYTYSLHFQYEGSLCYDCSDQRRIKPLTKDMIRENKINLIFNK